MAVDDDEVRAYLMLSINPRMDIGQPCPKKTLSSPVHNNKNDGLLCVQIVNLAVLVNRLLLLIRGDWAYNRERERERERIIMKWKRKKEFPSKTRGR